MKPPILLIPLLLLAAAGCSSEPPPSLYSLSPAANSAPDITMTTGEPAVQLQPVIIPDYLDTSDILLRNGQNALKVSATGRWAERLSDGLNQALLADLALRLPRAQVTAAPPSSKSALQILVTVDAFDVRPDGRCVLSATWTILDKNNQTVLVSERGVFAASATDSAGIIRDADIVSAMAEATGQLADAMEASVNEHPLSGLAP
jgi:uncharacterized lipoprotein YmbA